MIVSLKEQVPPTDKKQYITTSFAYDVREIISPLGDLRAFYNAVRDLAPDARRPLKGEKRDAALKLVADLAPTFTEITGFEPTPNAVGDVAQWKRTFDVLPTELPDRPVAPATAHHPSHFTGPSGKATVATFTIMIADGGSYESGRTLGKAVVVKAGKIVAKTSLADIEYSRATTADEETSVRPKDDWQPKFYTSVSVGAGDIGDVAFWLKWASVRNASLVRNPMRRDLAPASLGVRNAFQTNAKTFGKLDQPVSDVADSYLFAADLEKMHVPEGFDHLNIEALDDLALLYLPPEIASAARIVSPSTGHMAPGTTGKGASKRPVLDQNGKQKPEVRLRLFALLDTPVGKADLDLWVPEFDRKAGADRSLHTACQKIYISRPCFDATTFEEVADPLAHLVFRIMPGEPVAVVPDIEPHDVPVKKRSRQSDADDFKVLVGMMRARLGGATPPVKRRTIRATKDGGNPFAGKSFAAVMLMIGDHAEGQGFHEPIKMACDRAGREGLPWDEAFEQISAAVLAADTSNRSGGKSPSEYLRQFEREGPRLYAMGAARRQEAEAKAAASAASMAEIMAKKPLPTITAEEAYQQVKTTLEDAVSVARQTGYSWPGRPDKALLWNDDAEAAHAPYGALTDAILDLYEPPADTLTAETLTALAAVAERREELDGYSLAEAIHKAGASGRYGVVSVQVPPGVGKSHAASAVLSAHADDGKGVFSGFSFVTTTHDLAKQAREDLPGLVTYEGMDRLCLRWDDETNKYVPSGMARFREIWRERGGSSERFCDLECSYRKGCPYWAQTETFTRAQFSGFADGKRSICRSVPKVMGDAKITPADVTVLDEGTAGNLVEGCTFDLEKAGYDPAVAEQLAARLTTKINPFKLQNAIGSVALWLKKIARVFADVNTDKGKSPSLANLLFMKPGFHPSLLEVLRIHLEDFSRDLRDEIVAEEADSPKMTPLAKQVHDHVEFMMQAEKFAWALRRLKKTSRYDAETMILPGWAFGVRYKEIRNPDYAEGVDNANEAFIKKEVRCLHFCARRRVADAYKGKLLIHLDATARPETLKHMFDAPPMVLKLDVKEPEGSVVRRLRTARVGVERAADLAPYVERWGRVMVKGAGPGKVGVVTYLDTETVIMAPIRAANAAAEEAKQAPKKAFGGARGEVAPRGGAPSPISGPLEPKSGVAATTLAEEAILEAPDVMLPFAITHFGAHKGSNELEDVMVLGVFGRNLPPPDARAELHTALTGDPVLPDDGFTKAPSAVRFRDGTAKPWERWADANGGVADEAAREAEDSINQADGRGRAVRRSMERPLLSFIHTDAAVEDLLFDEWVHRPVELDGGGELAPELGETALAEDVVKVALALGVYPRGSMFWRAWLEVDQTAWEHRRLDGEIDGASLGEALDAAVAAAFAGASGDAGVAVIRIEGGEGRPSTMVTRDGAAALALLARIGLTGSVLTGKARREVLKSR